MTISAPAHRGVLLPEFGSRVLEVLHQPMEDKAGATSTATIRSVCVTARSA